MNDAHAVSLVVLLYNRWHDTRVCLASVFASDARAVNVIVVDNGSTDETLTALARDFPNVTLIRNSENVGYAEGNNIGIRAALTNNAEFIAVLNNDVFLAPDWLTPLLDALTRDEQAAFAGPLIFHADEPHVIQSAGGMLPQNWRAYHRGANELERGQYLETETVDWLSGCAILARARALDEIGLLDSDFFMYGEDVDWSLRAREKNYRVLFVPQSHVWHKGVQRNYAPPPRVTYYSARNELFLMHKHRANKLALARAMARHTRTALSWSVRPRWRDKRAHRDALVCALRDFVRGKRGAAAF